MSKYTTEVRYICETMAGLTQSEGYRSVNGIIEKAAPLIFDFPFPMFDESYRAVLEQKILKHFYTREIGLETVGLWKLKLDTKMNEIMPYYNQLYKSELLEFNPLYDVDLKTERTVTRDETENLSGTESKNRNENGTKDTAGTDSDTGKVENTSDTVESASHGIDTTGENTIDTNTNNVTDVNNTATLAHMDLYSDTPQGGVDGLSSGKYLTNARKVDDTNTELGKSTVTVTAGNQENRHDNTQDDLDRDMNVESNTSSEHTFDRSNNETYQNDTSESGSHAQDKKLNSIDDYIEHVTGKTSGVSYSKILLEFRKTFLNIDMLIIEELEELFMQLW